jgi:competence protein ComEA
LGLHPKQSVLVRVELGDKPNLSNAWRWHDGSGGGCRRCHDAHDSKEDRAMMQSLLFKLGLLIVAMGVSLWMIARSQPKDPIAAVTDERTGETLPRTPDLHEQTPKIHEVVGKTRETQQGQRLLDLNRASADELEALPGVGAVLAQRVIAFRTSAGGFRTIEDLREVKGIGSKKFDRIKSLVTVSAPRSRGAKQREL